MPSPIGHAIAGAAIAWIADAASAPRRQPSTLTPDPDIGIKPLTLTLVCAGLAMAPDLDLLAPYQHRTVTHSVVAVAAVAIIAIGVTGKVRGRVIWTAVWAFTAAYASHLLLDWLAEDQMAPRGLQILWPFSDRWLISGLDLFRGTERRDIFSRTSMRTNLIAIAQEIAILTPIAAAAWLVRVKALARFAAQMPSRHHAAE